jgi:hypothetical protein
VPRRLALLILIQLMSIESASRSSQASRPVLRWRCTLPWGQTGVLHVFSMMNAAYQGSRTQCPLASDSVSGMDCGGYSNRLRCGLVDAIEQCTPGAAKRRGDLASNDSTCAGMRILHRWGALRAAASALRTKAETSSAAELPRHLAGAHHAHHLTTNLVLDDRAPRDEAQAQPIVDHGKAAAGELR